MRDVFEFDSYLAFLTQALETHNKRSGLKSKLAKHLSCRPSFISSVLNGVNHLSLEHAEKCNSFFRHSESQADHFLLLVQKDRAGTASLKKYFEKKIEKNRISTKQSELSKALQESKINEKKLLDQYYSSWTYSAIHIGLLVPKFQNNIPELAKALSIDYQKALYVKNFLIDNGFLSDKKIDIHLTSDSYNILKHHTNWRLKAIDKVDENPTTDFHYSAAVSLSRNDRALIANQLEAYLLDLLKQIKKSEPVEEVCCLNLDFFSLLQK